MDLKSNLRNETTVHCFKVKKYAIYEYNNKIKTNASYIATYTVKSDNRHISVTLYPYIICGMCLFVTSGINHSKTIHLTVISLNYNTYY